MGYFRDMNYNKLQVNVDKNMVIVHDDTSAQEAGFHMEICFIKSDIIRCRVSKTPIKEIPSYLMEPIQEQQENLIRKVEQTESDLYLITDRLQLKVSLIHGTIQYYNADGSKLYHEDAGKELTEVPIMKYTTGDEKPVIKRVKTVDGERNFILNLREEADSMAYRVKYYCKWQDDEGVFGFGQAEEGIFNYRHQNQYLYQHNMRIPMPVFYSDRGYGLIFDCTSLMTFEDDACGSYLYLDAVKQLEYYYVAGESPDQFIAGLRSLTGRPAMLPKWAFGYIQSKEQYYTANELEEVVRKYRDSGIPIDGIVQDWNTWEAGNWGEKILDPDRYGTMKEVAKSLKKMNAHAMISVWPNMNSGGQNHTEFFEQGMLLNDYATYNAFDEKARQIYWEQMSRALFAEGFEAWWCDSTEPFSGPDWGGEVKREPWERFVMVGGEHKKYLGAEKANLYALEHAKGIYQNQRKETEEIRVLNLTRSGYLSGYKYAAMLWSGDTYASWDTMRKQIVEGLSMGLSGYPYWTLDIGGFFTVGDKWQNRGCGCNQDSTPKWFWKGEYNEGVNDFGYRELYVRWLQLGTFLPMFRSHGTDTPREIWNFGAPGEPFYDAIAKFIKLRYQLMPYIYSMAGKVYLEHATIMRSLMFDFMKDENARRRTDEFLFGDQILVCPVLEPFYYEADNKLIEKDKIRECYLPSGCGWYNFWTGVYYEGGNSYLMDAPIDEIPIFVKAGSIIPMAEGLQHASEPCLKNIKIYIYSGADTIYNLYEDAGNDYSYENGNYSNIRMQWMEDKKILQIFERTGTYRGMLQEREFEIILDGQLVDTIVYQGEALTILCPHDILMD